MDTIPWFLVFSMVYNIIVFVKSSIHLPNLLKKHIVAPFFCFWALCSKCFICSSLFFSTLIQTYAKASFGIKKDTKELLLYKIYISLESTYSLQIIIDKPT